MLCLFCCTSYAQTSSGSSYKLGLTNIFFGTGDVRGINLFNEYNHALSNHTSISPSLHIGYGSKGVISKKSAALDVNFFFSPMRFDQSKIRFGGGPSVRFISDKIEFSYNNRKPSQYFTVGYTVALEGEFNITSRFLVGVGGSIQPYASGEIVSKFGFNAGYRL